MNAKTRVSPHKVNDNFSNVDRGTISNMSTVTTDGVSNAELQPSLNGQSYITPSRFCKHND